MRRGSSDPRPSPDLAGPLLDRLQAMAGRETGPLIVGIDGRSGAGKSTLAAVVAAQLPGPGGRGPTVTVIEGDQFYAGGSAASWDRRPVAERVAWGIDWRRQRQVLGDLRRRGEAEWRPFDWEAPDWDADEVPLRAEPVRAAAGPGAVVILEGAYSCRPELHDRLDLRVLLLAPDNLRHRRLRARDGDAYHADWAARWTAAEDHYFGSVMTPARFHLVLGTDR